MHSANNLNSLAGSDTTAVALRAIFYHLIKNPDKYLKLQQEIDDAQVNGKLSEYITFEESQKLPYLYVRSVSDELYALLIHLLL